MSVNLEKNGALDADAERWNSEQEVRKKRPKKERKPDNEMSLNINSLMDIMVIMLVFLLKNYGEDPLKVVGEDLKVASSVTQLNPEDTTAITITRKNILVNDTVAADISAGKVDPSLKKGGDTGMQINPVFEKLNEAISKKKREMQLMGQTYEPTATIIADQTTPYRLVAEVMYTAGQAELRQFKFAVVKTTMASIGSTP